METLSLTEAEVQFEVFNPPCRFCKQYNGEEVIIDAWKKRVISHLIVTISEDGTQHVHGPINDANMMQTLIDIAIKETHKK